MSEQLLKALKRLSELRGTTLQHEVMKHNVEITERYLASGKPMPAANEAERVARAKAARKRAVDKARVKRQAARRRRAGLLEISPACAAGFSLMRLRE